MACVLPPFLWYHSFPAASTAPATAVSRHTLHTCSSTAMPTAWSGSHSRCPSRSLNGHQRRVCLLSLHVAPPAPWTGIPPAQRESPYTLSLPLPERRFHRRAHAGLCESRADAGGGGQQAVKRQWRCWGWGQGWRGGQSVAWRGAGESITATGICRRHCVLWERCNGRQHCVASCEWEPLGPLRMSPCGPLGLDCGVVSAGGT